jgi:hypothetical protein
MSGCNPLYSGLNAQVAWPVGNQGPYPPPQGQNMPAQMQEKPSQRQYPPTQVQDMPSKASKGGSQTASTKQNTGLSSQYEQARSQQSRPWLTQSEESRPQTSRVQSSQSQQSRPQTSQSEQSRREQSRREETIMSSRGRSERESQPASSRQQASMKPYVAKTGQPSTYPVSQNPNETRMPTNIDLLGNPNRTFVEGLEATTKMPKTQNPPRGETLRRDTTSTTRTNSSKLGKPSTYPVTQKSSDSRMPTNMDPLGNPNRTVVEGLLPKKDMSRVERAQKAEEERKRQK